MLVTFCDTLYLNNFLVRKSRVDWVKWEGKYERVKLRNKIIILVVVVGNNPLINHIVNSMLMVL